MYKIISAITIFFSSFILWIIYLANTGGHTILFDWVKMVPYGDKIGHFFLFGFLTLILNLTLKLKYYILGNFKVYLGTTIVSLFVVGEELSQAFFPTRTVDINDLVADYLGILFFTLLSHFLAKTHVSKSLSNDIV